MPASVRSMISPCSMPASVEGGEGGLEVVAGVHGEADVVEPGDVGVEALGRRRPQAEQGALRGLVDRAAEELRGRLADAGLVDAGRVVDRGRPPEEAVVELLRARDVGDGQSDVGEAGAADESHGSCLPVTPRTVRSRSDSSGASSAVVGDVAAGGDASSSSDADDGREQRGQQDRDLRLLGQQVRAREGQPGDEDRDGEADAADRAEARAPSATWCRRAAGPARCARPRTTPGRCRPACRRPGPARCRCPTGSVKTLPIAPSSTPALASAKTGSTT